MGSPNQIQLISSYSKINPSFNEWFFMVKHYNALTMKLDKGNT